MLPHPPKEKEKYIVFLHGTTWVTKQWPEIYWDQLGELAAQAGYRIKLSGGNAEEIARAERIASKNKMVDILSRMNISAFANLLANAEGAVAVDTGFGHLAGALDLPIVSIYGSTNPEYTGALGNSSVHIAATLPCAPCLARSCSFKGKAAVEPACYAEITPQRVWNRLMQCAVSAKANECPPSFAKQTVSDTPKNGC